MQSDADPLFNSWCWQTLWWKTYRDIIGGELFLLAFYRDSTLVGFAPFYICRRTQFGLLSVRSGQLVGMCWRDDRTLISEYLDVVALPNEIDSVRNECARIMFDEARVTELIIASTAQSDCWSSTLEAHGRGSHSTVRNTDASFSYQADLSGGFGAYTARLRASTRRSLLHLRRRLDSRGSVRLMDARPDSACEALSRLNVLHSRRWGECVFVGPRLDFHRQFVDRMAKLGHLRMSALQVGGETMSVLYDLCLGDRQYNIQSGFDPDFDRSLSLGLLHFGYALESAAMAGVKVYDFLAGNGRKTDYKRHLGQYRRRLSSVQYVRSRHLACLYRWHDRRRAAIESKLS